MMKKYFTKWSMAIALGLGLSTNLAASWSSTTIDSGLNDPRDSISDSVGNVYEALYGGGTVRKVTPDGVASDIAFISNASGIALGTAGVIYVGDDSQITQLTPIGGGSYSSSIFVGSTTQGYANGTGSAASFNHPSRLAFSQTTGNLYVFDRNNSVIRKVTSGGVVSTIAGQAGSTGSADGDALTVALF
ncbi:MAG: hypothetical protein ACK4V2_07440 [Pseudomonadota bacterium]|jgi:hypothetical protein